MNREISAAAGELSRRCCQIRVTLTSLLITLKAKMKSGRPGRSRAVSTGNLHRTFASASLSRSGGIDDCSGTQRGRGQPADILGCHTTLCRRISCRTGVVTAGNGVSPNSLLSRSSKPCRSIEVIQQRLHISGSTTRKPDTPIRQWPFTSVIAVRLESAGVHSRIAAASQTACAASPMAATAMARGAPPLSGATPADGIWATVTRCSDGADARWRKCRWR